MRSLQRDGGEGIKNNYFSSSTLLFLNMFLSKSELSEREITAF